MPYESAVLPWVCIWKRQKLLIQKDRHMHPSVDSSAIHNSQDMEPT